MAAIDDPRAYIKGLLTTGVTVTKDNGVTPAVVTVLYKDGPEGLRWLFSVVNTDVIIAVGRPVEREQGEDRRISGVPVRYNCDIPIDVLAVNKTGVTATKLLNKVRHDIITTVEASAYGSRVSIAVREDRGDINEVGGYKPLWVDRFICQFRPLKSVG